MGERIRVGVIGAGQFAHLAVGRFRELPEVEVVAVGNRHGERARLLAESLGARVGSVADVVGAPDVDLVYIATPPSTHAPIALDALAAGKHVVVEKPLAVALPDGEAVVSAAAARGLLGVTDLMQPYNPLVQAVATLVDDRILGEPLHARFENLASDEALAAGDHWFWDREVSGGILVEHAVHFFDLFDRWFGAGTAVAAQHQRRFGADLVDQVHVTTRHRGVVVQQYHGFHQAGSMDRQEIRIVFERGDLRLAGWIPTAARLHGLVDADGRDRLSHLFPGAEIEDRPIDAEPVGARGGPLAVTHEVRLAVGDEAAKASRYGEILTAFMADQLAWVLDRSHPRLVDEWAGLRSLALATAARAMSVEIPPTPPVAASA